MKTTPRLVRTLIAGAIALAFGFVAAAPANAAYYGAYKEVQDCGGRYYSTFRATDVVPDNGNKAKLEFNDLQFSAYVSIPAKSSCGKVTKICITVTGSITSKGTIVSTAPFGGIQYYFTSGVSPQVTSSLATMSSSSCKNVSANTSSFAVKIPSGDAFVETGGAAKNYAITSYSFSCTATFTIGGKPYSVKSEAKAKP